MTVKSLFMSLMLLTPNLYATPNLSAISYDQLFQAAISGNLTPFSTFKEFIEDNTFNFDVNAKDDKGNTFLHYALEYKHLPIVHLLINIGANPHLANNQGKIPFQIATNNMNLHKHRFCKVAGVLPNNCNDSYIRNFQPDSLYIALWGHLITLWYDHYIADYDIVQLLTPDEEKP